MDTKKFIEAKVREVEKYCAARKIALTTFGTKVCNTTSLYDRLCGKRGNVTIATLMKVDEYMAKNQ